MLDFATKKVLKLKYNYFRMFVMPILVRNDNLFVILAHLGQRYEYF